MTDIENIQKVHDAGVNLMGFIFFDQSKRYIPQALKVQLHNHIPSDVQRVGVLVNADIAIVNQCIQDFSLDYVQLHGEESPEYCAQIKGAKVIKAFRVNEAFNFNETKNYSNCDLFLFDAKGKEYGGNGIRFNWQQLLNYTGDVPFLLSGGIGPDDANEILIINHEKFKGIDLNSGFEIKPGLKDVIKIKKFINQLSCVTK